jgi:hypothetical protein
MLIYQDVFKATKWRIKEDIRKKSSLNVGVIALPDRIAS